MPVSRISVAVHRLTRLYIDVPAAQLSMPQLREFTGLDPDEMRIVADALKDAGFLKEREDGMFVVRAAG